MLPRHPFEWLSVAAQKRAFPFFVLVTLGAMYALQVSGAPLRTDAAPAGILSFEFAGDLASARQMIESWGATGRVYAGLNLGLDYVFMVAYPLALALGCVLVARAWTRGEALAMVGIWLAWAQFAAGLLDAIENYALIQVLLGSPDARMPALAWWCAFVKFVIVGAGLVYVLIGGPISAIARRTKRVEETV